MDCNRYVNRFAAHGLLAGSGGLSEVGRLRHRTRAGQGRLGFGADAQPGIPLDQLDAVDGRARLG
jgi:hypothetical protein